jgi:hypothetical protein
LLELAEAGSNEEARTKKRMAMDDSVVDLSRRSIMIAYERMNMLPGSGQTVLFLRILARKG